MKYYILLYYMGGPYGDDDYLNIYDGHKFNPSSRHSYSSIQECENVIKTNKLQEEANNYNNGQIMIIDENKLQKILDAYEAHKDLTSLLKN